MTPPEPWPLDCATTRRRTTSIGTRSWPQHWSSACPWSLDSCFFSASSSPVSPPEPSSERRADIYRRRSRKAVRGRLQLGSCRFLLGCGDLVVSGRRRGRRGRPVAVHLGHVLAHGWPDHRRP